jgi:hypothetical protein
LHKAFEVHKLNDEGFRRAKELAEEFDVFLSRLERICHRQEGNLHTSEFSRAVQHLELASFYSKKTIAQDRRFQEGYNELDMLKAQPPVVSDYDSRVHYADSSVVAGSRTAASLDQQIKQVEHHLEELVKRQQVAGELVELVKRRQAAEERSR